MRVEIENVRKPDAFAITTVVTYRNIRFYYSLWVSPRAEEEIRIVKKHPFRPRKRSTPDRWPVVLNHRRACRQKTREFFFLFTALSDVRLGLNVTFATPIRSPGRPRATFGGKTYRGRGFHGIGFGRSVVIPKVTQLRRARPWIGNRLSRVIWSVFVSGHKSFPGVKTAP